MNAFLLLGSVGMPLAMGIGGIVAWRATRSQQDREDKPQTWHDDSLDDWRRERDARAEAARERRAAGLEDTLQAESRAEDQQHEQHHTRMGG